MTEPDPSHRRSGTSVELHSTVPRARVNRSFILDCVKSGASRLRRPIGQLNLVLINDRRMATLHRNYSGVAGTTDVLAFDLSESRDIVEGDVYICLDQAKRQAKRFHVLLREEVGRLAVHGVLHLAGLDDKSELGRHEMRKLEDASLTFARRRLK